MAFKKVRHSHLYDQKSNRWDIEIWQKNFTGNSIEFQLQGEGFEVTWNGQGDTRENVFLASELTLNYFIENQTDEDFIYNDILKDGQNSHYVRVYKTPSGGAKQIWWFGWMSASFDAIENAPFPYIVRLNATDSYGFFKSRSKDSFTDYTDKTSYQKITQILGRQDDPDSGNNHRGFLGKMNLMPSLDGTSNLTPCPHRTDGNESSGTNYTIIMKNMINWFRRNSSGTINDYNITYNPPGSSPALRDPFFNYYFSKSPFGADDSYDENNQLIEPIGDALDYKESDVFDSVLKLFGAVGVLSEGSYRFFQPSNYIGNTNGEVPVYNYRTSSQMSEAITLREQESTSSDLLIIDQINNVILGGSSLTYENSIKDVTLSFNEGFSVSNVEQGVALDTSIGIGSLSSIDHGPIEIDFFALAKEIVNEPAASTSSSVPRFTSADYRIYNHGIKTNTRLKIKQLQPDGTYKYLQENSNSNILTWTNTDTTISIIRGDIDFYGNNDPVNDTSLIAEGMINCGQFTTVEQSGDIISSNTFGVNNDKRLTTTRIRFKAFIEKPVNTGGIFIEATSRNSTTGSFVGHYKQMKSSGAGPDPFGTIGGVDNNPTFVSSETICEQINIYYTDAEQGESLSSKVIYKSEQSTVSSNASVDLGTTLIGQTAINPQASICFRNATASASGGSPATYPNYNESDQFEIEPCLDGFVRGGTSTDVKNICQLATNEYLRLQSEPLEILQADIFSADISPTKLIKYRINGDSGDYKYYIFKGGTFKAESATMSGEWYKVNQSSVIINDTSEPDLPPTPEPVPPGGGANKGIISSDNVPDSIMSENTKISDVNTENIKANFNLNILGVTTTNVVASSGVTKIFLSSTIEGRYYKNQKLYLTAPDGSKQLEITCASEKVGVNYVDITSVTPINNYPPGSLILTKTSDLTNVKAENVLDIRTAHYHNANTSETYIPLSGASIASSNTLSSSDYQLMFTVPYNGFVKKILNYNSHTGSRTSTLRFYKDGDSTTRIGDALGVSSYTTTFEVDCPSNWTFTKGDIISISREDTSQIQNTSMTIVLQYNTQPTAQP